MMTRWWLQVIALVFAIGCVYYFYRLWKHVLILRAYLRYLAPWLAHATIFYLVMVGRVVYWQGEPAYTSLTVIWGNVLFLHTMISIFYLLRYTCKTICVRHEKPRHD